MPTLNSCTVFLSSALASFRSTILSNSPSLPRTMRPSSRLALVHDLRPAVEVRRDLGVVRVDDHRDGIRTGLAYRVENPVDHGAAAKPMQDLGSPRPHAGAVTGGQDDGR